MKIPPLSSSSSPHAAPPRFGSGAGAPTADAAGPGIDPAWRARCEHDYLVEAQIRFSQALRLWLARRAPDGANAHGLCRDFAGEQSELAREIAETSPMNDATRGLFLRWTDGRGLKIADRLERLEREQALAHAHNLHEERVRDIFSWCGPETADYEDACEQLEECFRLAVGQGLYSNADAGQALARARASLKELLHEAFTDSGVMTPDGPESNEEQASDNQGGCDRTESEEAVPGFSPDSMEKAQPLTSAEVSALEAAALL